MLGRSKVGFPLKKLLLNHLSEKWQLHTKDVGFINVVAPCKEEVKSWNLADSVANS